MKVTEADRRRFEAQNRILDMAFQGKLKRAAALAALGGAGVSAEEARGLVAESVRAGKESRKRREEA